MSRYPHIEPAGEGALILYLGEQANEQVANRIAALLPIIGRKLGSALVDLVPSYNSVLVQYQPLVSDHFQVSAWLQEALDTPAKEDNKQGKLVELPVYYSEQSGPDLSRLARQAGLGIEEVITLHQQGEYRVFAIGFAPGFAYLGEVDKRIAAPRLATPRKKVPKGAVAIADRQTAVYPAPSPGGWNLIGLCPTPMFDPNASPPMPVQVGDRVRFRAIDEQSFIELGGKLEAFE